MNCPNCKTPMEFVPDGVINEPVIRTGTGTIARVSRPAAFWACSSCEHCEEA